MLQSGDYGKITKGCSVGLYHFKNVMNQTILVIDDNEEFAQLLEIDLQRHGFQVYVATSAKEALRQFPILQPDLVLLDVALPGSSGFEVCQRIRSKSNVPILMMSGHATTESELVSGLNVGADEYMVKPLRKLELHARIKALLRRAGLDESRRSLYYRDDYLHVDLATRHVLVGGHEVRLTPTEFKLLAVLIGHAGELVTFEQLLDEVWGSEYTREYHYPRIYVSHLRRKIEPDPANPSYIHNEYGIGYRFVGRTTK